MVDVKNYVLFSCVLLSMSLSSVLALEASLGGVAGEGLGAESTFDRNNLGQVAIIKSKGHDGNLKQFRPGSQN